MKLWHVIQWGNQEEGPDGQDTQCIVSAIDLQAAIAKATMHFDQYNWYGDNLVWRQHKQGQADLAILLGQDHQPEGKPILVIPIWLGVGDNLSDNPAWYRHPRDGWITQQQMFGEE